jgi:hypothetical protein
MDSAVLATTFQISGIVIIAVFSVGAHSRSVTGLLPIVVGALIALICAWLVNSIIRLMSGYDPGSVTRTWWDIFSKMGSRPAAYAEPLPELLQPRRFAVGDKIRILRVPLNADHSVSPERQELLQRCVGRVLRVDAINDFGALELHVRDDGTQASNRTHHIVLVEPEYAEPAARAPS